MAEFLQNNRTALRTCILNEFLHGKSVDDAYENLCKVMEKCTIDIDEFKYWYRRFSDGKFDLDHDKSQNQGLVSFSDLPIEILSEIMGKLDLISRLQVRKTSGLLRDVINEQKKFKYKLIGIETASDHITLQFDENSIRYRKMETGGCIIVYRRDKKRIEGGDFVEMALNDLAIAMRKSQMEKFEVILHGNRSLSVSTKCLEFLKSLLNSSTNPQIHVKTTHIEAPKCDDVASILACLKPGILKNMTLASGEMNEEILNEIVETEHFKQAKTADFSNFPTPISIPIERFFHFDSFEIYMDTVSTPEIIRIREALSTSSNFHRCQVTTRRSLTNFSDVGILIGAAIALNIPNELLKMTVKENLMIFERSSDERP